MPSLTCARWTRVGLLSLVLVLAQTSLGSADPYDEFRVFAESAFGAEREPLVYETFGGILDLPADWWEFVSESSAVIGFSTNLPARSHIEYGAGDSFQRSTVPTDRHYSNHLHYLTGLEPDVEHQYRVVMIDERGTQIRSAPRTLLPRSIDHAIRIPGNVSGPPYVLENSNAYYLLERDIHANDTAILIRADDITLDLGAHEVTYNNRTVSPTGGWLQYIEEAGFGIRSEGGRGLTIVNGRIRQGIGNGAGHRSESIGFNPVLLQEASHLDIAGLTLEYSGPQLAGLVALYPSGFNSVHHNVFVDRGTILINRHGVGSKSMAIHNDISTFHTHHNLVKRTRQSALDGARINDNEIYIDSHATNSFGIPGLQNDREAFGNRIFGTGYHVVGMGWGRNNWWHDNFIHLVGQGPSPRSPEYGDQESLNGIRLTQYGGAEVDYSDSIVEDNVIVISGGGCDDNGRCTIARGLQWASDPHVRDNVIRNNTIKVVMNDEVSVAAALVTQGMIDRCGTEEPVLYMGNRLISNITTLRLGDSYGTGCNHVFVKNSLVRVGSREDFRTFRFAYPVPVVDQFMYDSELEGGAELGSVGFSHPGQELTVGWTLDVTVLEGGEAVPGADVVFRAVDGSGLAVRSTDSLGVASARVTQYVANSRGRIYRTPTQVSIFYRGATISRWIEVQRPTSTQITIEAKSRELDWRKSANGGITFAWDGPIDGPAVLSVSDLNGNSIREVQLSEGATEFLWDAQGTGGDPLIGTFVARLARSGGTQVCALTLTP
jgi:hypothetical protein